MFPPESAPPTPAMFTRTRTQPWRRHSSGSTISTACTRPGGTVRVSVFARPNFRRSPSGDWVTVKLKYLMNSANTMMIGRPPVTSAIPRPPQPLLSTVTTTITTVSSSSPAVTLRIINESARSRGVTDVIGISGASPTSCRSPAARASTSLRRARASSSDRNWSLTRESPAPGDLDGDLGHGEEPGEERLGHVDGLEPAQLEPPLLLGDHSGVHPEVAVVVEPEPQVAPGQVLPAGDERRQHGDRRDGRPGRH